MFCKNCGAKLEQNTIFCSSCGKKIVEYTNTESKVPTPGKGKAISSMVLGIIAIVWAFIVLLSLANISPAVQNLNLIAEDNVLAAIIGFFIGLNLFSLPTGIPGLVLGLCSKYKSGMRTSGIITCSISLFVALISLILIFINIV